MIQVYINYVAIVVAAIANMVLGFMWFGPRPHNPNLFIPRCRQFSNIARRGEEAVISALR